MGVRVIGQDLELWLRSHAAAQDNRKRDIRPDVALSIVANAMIHLSILLEAVRALSNISGG